MAAFTATQGSVRELAERALAARDGVTVWFRVEKYGSMEACAVKARSFQVAFCSLRAKVRRQATRKALGLKEEHMTYAKDADTQGKYDGLGCSKLPLPNNEGWKVELARYATITFDLEVTDNATGERLSDFNQDEKRLKEVIQQFAHMRMLVHGTANKLYDPLTKEDRDWFVAYNWEWAYETYEQFGVVPNPVAAYADLRGQLPPEPKVVPSAAPYMAPQPVDNDHGPFKFSGVPVITHNDPKLDPANIPEDVDIFSGLPLDGTNPEG